MSHAIIDTRNLDYNRLKSSGGFSRIWDSFSAAGDALGQAPHPTETQANAYTGHLAELRSKNAASGFSHAGAASDGEFILAAKSFVQSVGSVVGFEAGTPIEFEGDSTVTYTSGDARVVSLQQTVNGIEVWGMEPKVYFHSDGSVDRMVGDTVSIAASEPTAATVAPETALLVAARAAAAKHEKTDMLGRRYQLPELDLSHWTPLRTGQENRAPRTTAFDSGPFAEIGAASLVYFYMGDQTRLAWRFIISRYSDAAQSLIAAQFLILVEASSADPAAPAILYMSDMVSCAIGGQVYAHNPDEGAYLRVDFPLPLDAYQLPLPPRVTTFPLPWTAVRDGQLSTQGNNVLGLDGASGKPYSFAVTGATGDFTPTVHTSEQYVTNIFFFCNYMHDFFLLLGFDEANGNFQETNESGAGKGADPVHAYAYPGEVDGVANMLTRADGRHAEMNMGLVKKTGRHTANDADVVFHEYVHGVTSRLVGGMRDGQGLNEAQSRALGEGWGDFFALTIRNFSRSTERVVTGTYVTGEAAGIRQQPYDEHYPGTFGDFGKQRGEVVGHPQLSYAHIHGAGEVWCAALMHMVRTVTQAVGADKTRAYQLCWQAVVDGLKLTPKNPTFLTARNAIMKAWASMQGTRVSAAEYPAVQRAVWEAFAKFGMGYDASCQNASLRGCVSGRALPPDGWED